MKKSFFALGLWLSIIGLASPALARVTLVNTQQVSLRNINSITISYVSESVQIVTGSGQDLILREYLSQDRRSCFAEIEQNGSSLVIANGNRPWFRSLAGRIVVEIPASYTGSLSLATVSGQIELTRALNLNQLAVQTTSGAISLASLIVADLQVKSVSGKLELYNIYAQMTLDSISGAIDLKACRGPIVASSTSGAISLRLDELLGNLDLRTVSGKIELRLPRDAIYSLRADAISGDVDLDLEAPRIIRQGGSATAVSGFENSGRLQIDLRSTSGAIKVSH